MLLYFFIREAFQALQLPAFYFHRVLQGGALSLLGHSVVFMQSGQEIIQRREYGQVSHRTLQITFFPQESTPGYSWCFEYVGISNGDFRETHILVLEGMFTDFRLVLPIHSRAESKQKCPTAGLHQPENKAPQAGAPSSGADQDISGDRPSFDEVSLPTPTGVRDAVIKCGNRVS